MSQNTLNFLSANGKTLNVFIIILLMSDVNYNDNYFTKEVVFGFLQDAKFVEERRKQLQGYLRMVMNKVIQALPEFTTRPSKETLLSLLPFCL